MKFYKPYQGNFKTTQGFGPSSGLAYLFHYGMDIATPKGTALVACFDGDVVEVARSFIPMKGYGKYVVIQSIVDGSYTALYGHMSEVFVRKGDRVHAGLIIGRSGNTGYVVSFGGGGYHLHFGLKKDGVWIDPFPFYSKSLIVQAAEPVDPAEPDTYALGVPAVPASPALSYTVRRGDSLWKLAQRYYGDGQKYSLILQANSDKIKNANVLAVGLVLVIPSIK